MIFHRYVTCFVVAALSFTVLSSCGYQFAGTVSRLPEDVTSISLGTIQNRTREVGLERFLLESIEDEIALRGRLRIVPKGQGDVELTGAIRSYETRPVAFNSRDEVLQYQVTISVALDLRRRGTGDLLWKTSNLREVQAYSAIPGVVVTGSSQFQQGSVPAEDLGQFTDIQVSEGQRREASERVIETLARSIYNQMMEDF
jgi:hypothetical protein